MVKKIQKNICNGNIEKALEKIMLIFRRRKIPSNNVILLINQLKCINKDYLCGLITRSYFDKNIRRITSAILNLLDTNLAELKKNLSY